MYSALVSIRLAGSKELDASRAKVVDFGRESVAPADNEATTLKFATVKVRLTDNTRGYIGDMFARKSILYSRDGTSVPIGM
mmetsp:Transcript_26554/g.64191  ORF Transcript_26554/g.64191 Transcript_26554/m.64191 type:complete len:81 (+) Transcript_26554:733-975(+)